ncbi:MAG: DMT family transporter [Thermoplasmata archaeon]|nr:DMT family transporter [Thermoplasmata archaeon]MCJ7562555.1 DMT family transporter [Thermoplasmata archaeon]
MKCTKAVKAGPILALSAVALWALALPLIQEGLLSCPPVFLGFARYALASLLMVGLLCIRYRTDTILTTLRREWKELLVFGVLYVAVPNAAQNLALQNSSSSLCSVIQSAGPVITLLFASLVLNERMTRMKAIGITIALTGTILAILQDGIMTGGVRLSSSLLVMASAISFGLAWVFAKRMLDRNPPLLVIGLSLPLGTLAMGPMVLIEAPLRVDMNAHAWLIVAILGLLCGGMASILYLMSLECREVSRIVFYTYLMPVFTALFEWILRAKVVSLWTAMCAPIIVLGIIIADHNFRWTHHARASDREQTEEDGLERGWYHFPPTSEHKMSWSVT